MAGSKIGGKKVVETRVQKYMSQGYGEIEARKMVSDDYRRIGAIGGSVKGTEGGFAADKNRARVSGALGGHRSKRGYKYIKDTIDGSLYIDVVTDEVVEYKYDGTVERRKRSPEIQNI